MTGNKIIDTALVGLSTLVSLGVLGVFIYAQVVYQKPIPSDSAQRKELLTITKEKIFIEAYKIDKLIINLHSHKNRLRFLDVEMYLRPFKPKQTDLFQENKAFIYDSIIDIASHMKPEELNSLYGKTLLEDRIKKRINGFFSQPTLREIFFTRFVVQ